MWRGTCYVLFPFPCSTWLVPAVFSPLLLPCTSGGLTGTLLVQTMSFDLLLFSGNSLT